MIYEPLLLFMGAIIFFVTTVVLCEGIKALVRRDFDKKSRKP